MSTSLLSKPFTDGLAQGLLRYQRCERCGAAQRLVSAIEEATGLDTRSVVLGHLLRGGPPNARDRLYSLRFGAAAVRALAEGRVADMVALDPPNVRYLPLEEATRHMKTVPLDCDSILTARSLGTCLGDA